MDDLKKQAAELGISVDNRWGKDRLREEIDQRASTLAKELDVDVEALGPNPDLSSEVIALLHENAAKPEPFGGKGDHDGDGKAGGSVKTPERLIPVKIERDFWDAEGTRHRKGAIVEVSVEAALDGVESGALSRVK